MSEKSRPDEAAESTSAAGRAKARSAAKKAADKVEEAAEHVVEAVRDGFDKVIESIDDLQKPKR